MEMNQFDYEFLTDRWTGVRGAAYNATMAYCSDFGWFTGYNPDGTPNITEKGHNEIKKFLDAS